MSHAVNPHEFPTNDLITPVALEEVSAESQTLLQRAATATVRGGQIGIISAEMNPLINEGAIRIPLYLGAEVASHGNPVVGAAVLGLSTLALEGGAAWAASSLLGTERAARWESQAHKFIEKHTDTGPVKLPWKVVGTALGGTVVGMELDRHGVERTTAESKRFGLRAAVGLSGALAVVGAMGPEVVHEVINNLDKGAEVATVAAGTYLVTKVVKRHRAEATVPGQAEQLKDYDRKHGISFTVPVDPTKLAEIAALEQDVWYAKGYGSLDEYAEHIEHSITLGASQGDKVIGMARMFDGTKKMPPFLEMDFFDPELKEKVMRQSADGKIVEMGTLAKLDSAPRNIVMRGLLRMFYREAKRRNAENMACIMEPWRVQRINKRHGLIYEQVGPAIPYQGGDCAPHIMNIEKAEKNMRLRHPLAYYWFVKQALKS